MRIFEAILFFCWKEKKENALIDIQFELSEAENQVFYIFPLQIIQSFSLVKGYGKGGWSITFW